MEFFIPKKIKIGYQKRTETYTNKLAYIIYYDHKNVLRQETSWESWRDSSIDPDNFDNEPIEGFVLNKNVGGCRTDWAYRNAYIRVWDPRGFEFEITLENLLFILEWNDSYAGKGLSGKYCYAWCDKKVYLLPVNTEDYRKSKIQSDAMYDLSNKKSELIPGALYKIKKQSIPNGWYMDKVDELVYIGNLKTSIKMDKKYKSTLYFTFPNTELTRKQYNNDYLISISKSAVLSLIDEHYYTQDQIAEFIHRFDISAYSYNFWHNKDIIEKFTSVPINKFYNEITYSGLKIYKAQQFNIIDDNTVTIYKYMYNIESDNSYSYYAHFDVKNKLFKFITLKADLTYKTHSDCGIVKKADLNGYIRQTTIQNLEEDYAKSTSLEDFSYLKSDKGLTPLYYITKDNYESDSIMQCMYYNNLSYVADQCAFKIILLPKLIK